MKTTILLALGIMLLVTDQVTAQMTIDVAENTLKVPPSGEEIFYYGFAEGDQIIFSFTEMNGKELKELEITGPNSSSLFLDYKSKKIENKTLSIPETGIYKFRFANSNIIAGRVCKFKIQRVPGSEATAKFNTTVYKRTLYDTTYYDAQERYLVRSDTSSVEVLNQTAKVHSSLNANGNTTTTNFSLPQNTISWSYYIGVDQAGQEAYEAATKQLRSASGTISKLVGANPMTALALGLPSYLSQWQKGEDIQYCLMLTEFTTLYYSGQPYRYYKKGLVINDFSKMEPISGNLSFCLTNDNAVQGVTVTIKVTAIQVQQVWDTRPVKRSTITSKQELYLKG